MFYVHAHHTTHISIKLPHVKDPDGMSFKMIFPRFSGGSSSPEPSSEGLQYPHCFNCDEEREGEKKKKSKTRHSSCVVQSLQWMGGCAFMVQKKLKHCSVGHCKHTTIKSGICMFAFLFFQSKTTLRKQRTPFARTCTIQWSTGHEWEWTSYSEYMTAVGCFLLRLALRSQPL